MLGFSLLLFWYLHFVPVPKAIYENVNELCVKGTINTTFSLQLQHILESLDININEDYIWICYKHIRISTQKWNGMVQHDADKTDDQFLTFNVSRISFDSIIVGEL